MSSLAWIVHPKQWPVQLYAHRAFQPESRITIWINPKKVKQFWWGQDSNQLCEHCINEQTHDGRQLIIWLWTNPWLKTTHCLFSLFSTMCHHSLTGTAHCGLSFLLGLRWVLAKQTQIPVHLGFECLLCMILDMDLTRHLCIITYTNIRVCVRVQVYVCGNEVNFNDSHDFLNKSWDLESGSHLSSTSWLKIMNSFKPSEV